MSAPQVIFVPVQGQNNGQPLHVGVASPEQVPKSQFHLLEHSNGMASNEHLNNTTNGSHTTNNSHFSGHQATNGAHKTDDSSFVKQITSDPSILYSFINWENPGRTFASLITVLSLIISTRYFSPLQWILKILCTILGATSLVEAMGRVATKDGVMTRVRPRSYYRPSKQTYSRLFSEIEQAVDMSLVKLQRIIFMEDLTGGLIGFALTFAAYWIVQVVPPFWLAIGTTLLTYTLGPVLTGPHSANLKPAIENKARDLKNQAVDTASSAGNHTVNKTQELSSRAIDTASSAGNQTVNKAQELSSRAQETASSAGNQTINKTQDLSSRAMDTASSAGNQTINKTQEYGSRAMDTASSAGNHAANKTQEFGSRAQDTASSAGNHAANKTQEYGSRAMDTASSAGNHAANKTQEYGSRAQDTASSATNNAAAKAHNIQGQTHDYAAHATDRTANYPRGGAGTYGAPSYESAPPNAFGVDGNDMSRDRRVQVHPTETTHTAI